MLNFILVFYLSEYSSAKSLKIGTISLIDNQAIPKGDISLIYFHNSLLWSYIIKYSHISFVSNSFSNWTLFVVGPNYEEKNNSQE